ncbi:polysaccharide synthesis [Photobacterium frigidiphilum]|uniref:Polysaccharide synthesis n=1 Tax=Photobacterium frigidiphilum TaxID=264736 RepID=A0A2T3JPD5_9GAMM|nr:capsule biosynthesis GfcC family protein [Photobacterium frigidiphilum]PSU50921.1 polysaccharide synthesis [Photobacterium frigidiphilum]
MTLLLSLSRCSLRSQLRRLLPLALITFCSVTYALAADTSIISGTATLTSTDAKPFAINVTTSSEHERQLQLSYSAPVRIKQVLSDSLTHLPTFLGNDVKQDPRIYWTGAALFQAFPHPQQQTVVDQINQLATYWHDERQQAVLKLSQQIEQLTTGERIFTSLDYDNVRLNKQANTLITHDLTLILPPRPERILVLGALEKSVWAKWQTRFDAEDYLKQGKPLSNANNSDAWVIQPDGTVEQHPIAYWNRDHHDIAPGAIVYLSFSSLPKGFETLNEDIINLLRNRAL